jgi:hypothetical protein
MEHSIKSLSLPRIGKESSQLEHNLRVKLIINLLNLVHEANELKFS